MQVIELSSWASFKETCITNKGLKCQAAENPERYVLYGPDGAAILWMYLMPKSDPKSAEQIDFEDNYKSDCNQPIELKSSDGLEQVNAVTGIDPKYMCFCQGVSGSPTPANPYIDWAVPPAYASVQIVGAKLVVKDGADFDSVDLLVGMEIPEVGWYQISQYAFTIPVISDGVFKFDKEACKKSNPIPTGITMRLKYNFANPGSPSTPKVGMVYSLERPYA